MSEKSEMEEKAIAENEAIGSSWSDEEDSLLRETFPFSTDDELTDKLGRSINSIKGRAYRLGLKKHWSFVQKVHKQNAKQRWEAEKSKGKASIKINPSSKAKKL